MRITEKELSKLNQLDRIEFRQKYERLDERYNLYSGAGFLIKILSFVFLFVLTFYILGVIDKLSALRIVGKVFYVSLWYWVLTSVLSLTDTIVGNKKKKELIGEYFSEKIEIRRVNEEPKLIGKKINLKEGK